ncbi:MAG: 4-(cytidine 5'-diphospho)-2-C-methyl-D-erythritol kinase [Hyphomicrobiales bacterium]|nr:4-(cytidine 5'-diphospho)-2-C-methyl-D-erythritol kinase [Hyphomicrobiales bacterium]
MPNSGSGDRALDAIPVREFAPAKLNLALHVTGRRSDGYHLLESLVVFADISDVVTAEADSDLSLRRSGAFAERLGPPEDDLVLRAAARLRNELTARGTTIGGARLHLEKNLPVASGLGGGSADAAATLRALCRLWVPQIPAAVIEPLLAEIAVGLGADVPMCLASWPALVSGIGEQIAAYDGLPGDLHLVLVNPGVGLATPEVFRALDRRENPPPPPLPDQFEDVAALVEWLGESRNDLQASAIGLAPEIGVALALIGSNADCLLARMSGSGATSFGIFATADAATDAAAAIAATHPDWWVAATRARAPRAETASR